MNKFYNFLLFPLNVVCVFFMCLRFGKEGANRMLIAEKTYLQKKLNKLENHASAKK